MTISLKKPRIRLRRVPIPMVVAALAILWFSDIRGSKNERSLDYRPACGREGCNQRFCSLESRKDLDISYLKMLEKSIIPYPSPLPWWEKEWVRGRKEANFWQPIYRLLKGQDKMKNGDFKTSRSNPP
jgi:hypothetical protein